VIDVEAETPKVLDAYTFAQNVSPENVLSSKLR
jgi:hypothetical protein